MKSVASGKYFSHNAYNKDVTITAAADRDVASDWEKFVVKSGDYGNVGLKASNGNYLSARISIAGAPIQASGIALRGWENFRIFERENKYYIQSQANGKYVQVYMNNEKREILACGNAPKSWEAFSLFQF